MSKKIRPLLGALLYSSLVATAAHAAPGDWDRSFAQNGRISLEIAGNQFMVQAWEPQPDGKVVLVGHMLTVVGTNIIENEGFVAARVNTNGTLDSSFDGDGYLNFNFDFGSTNTGSVDLELQADGKLLIVGQAGINLDQARLLRLNTNGSRDITYGPAGEVPLSVPGASIMGPRLKLTAAGAALVYAYYGVNNSGTPGGVFLARVTAAGALDATFGTGGSVVFQGTDQLTPEVLVLAADGSITLGGTLGPYMHAVPVVARLTSTGQPDANFGTAGLVPVSFLQGDGWISAMALAPNGQIVVAGLRHDGNGRELPFIARFRVTGALDGSFGSSGRIIPVASRIDSLLVESDGRIVAAGLSPGSSGGPSFLARYNTDGSPDLTFGTRGISRTDFATDGAASSSTLSQLKRNADGSYQALVRQYSPMPYRNTFAVARFLAQGASAGVLGIRAQFEAEGFVSNSVREDQPTQTFYVTRTGGADGAVSVQYRVLGETATAGQDFVAATGTITLNDGEVSGSFEVQVIDDSIPENNFHERFYAELFAPTGGAGLSKTRATVEIFRDEDFGDRVWFVSSQDSHTEDGGPVRLRVNRTGDLRSALTLNYAITPGTASAGSDFTTASGTLQWPANEGGGRSFDVALVDDGVGEENEQFTVTISDPTNTAVILEGSATIGIVDDDNTGAPAAVAFAANRVFVNEGDGTATVVLRRLGETAQALTVPWSLGTSAGAGAAIAGEDYVTTSGTVSWTAGETAPKTISVPLIDDSSFEVTKVFAVSISPSFPVLSANDTFGWIFINDNDGTPTQPVISVGAGGPVAESAGTFVVPVTLSGHAAGTNTVGYAIEPETASEDDVFVGISGTFTWNVGDNTVKNLYIRITPDTLDEFDETFRVNLFSPSGGASLGNQSSQFTITDDDPTIPGQPPQVVPGIEAVASTVTVSEATQTATVQLRRVGETTRPMSAYFTSLEGTAATPSDFVVLPGFVNWDANETSVKTIEVQINGDAIVESTEALALQVAQSALTGSAQTFDLSVSITDDDGGSPQPPPPAQVAFPVTTSLVPEAAIALTVRVGRTGNTDVASSIDYATNVGTAGAADFTAISGTLTWAPGETGNKDLTVQLLPDAADETDETFTITLSNPSSGTTLSDPTMTVTITDDDVPGSGGVIANPPVIPPSVGGGGGASTGGGKGGGGGSESLLSLLLYGAMLGWRRHRRRLATVA